MLSGWRWGSGLVTPPPAGSRRPCRGLTPAGGPGRAPRSLPREAEGTGAGSGTRVVCGARGTPGEHWGEGPAPSSIQRVVLGPRELVTPALLPLAEKPPRAEMSQLRPAPGPQRIRQ
ncbi:unnamed protein product [Rangifer tarandus platyrhynchus]|uniref:Uncharacterized protein n=1 Tax=Rangifer tarandus platyrhynchus TaxID=3082113 RepID=A0AC59Y489_RANTA